MVNIDAGTELDAVDVSAPSGSLVPRLRFTFDLRDSNNNYEIDNIYISGDAIIKAEAKQVSLPAITTPTPTIEGTNSTEFTADCEFSRHAIERLEELRDGNPITFELTVTIEATNTHNDDWGTARKTLQFEPAQSQWTDILDTFDYHDRRVVDIPLTAGPAVRDLVSTAYARVERA